MLAPSCFLLLAFSHSFHRILEQIGETACNPVLPVITDESLKPVRVLKPCLSHSRLKEIKNSTYPNDHRLKKSHINLGFNDEAFLRQVKLTKKVKFLSLTGVEKVTIPLITMKSPGVSSSQIDQ